MRRTLLKIAAAATLCIAGFPLLIPAQNGQAISHKYPQPPPATVFISMRDGVQLAADLFRPETGSRWPTVLIRTPYGRRGRSMKSYLAFVRRGYALVIEDLRGRHDSQGTFGTLPQEGLDAADTLNWIAAQTWSDGRVAMAGSSYLGLVQWWAAIQDNPHLLAIAPMNSGDDDYLDRFYSPGGALKLGHRLVWFSQNFTPAGERHRPLNSYIFHLPLRTADLAAADRPIPQWRAAIAHPSKDAYWTALSVRPQLNRVKIPVLSMSGWFDNYAESELDAFTRLAKQGTPVETWIGPWAHDPRVTFPTRNFGPLANIPIRALQGQWFDEWLRRPETPGSSRKAEPVLHLFVMGPDIWRDEHEWPLARTRYTPLHLESGGHANSLAGDGILSWSRSGKASNDGFNYDPANPVPTVGGALCCDPRLLPAGPLDQSKVEERPDVLVYTSAPLASDLEVTGPVRVLLYVSTSANDTDFTAKLVDVDLHGRPLLVADGIQRLRYRLSLQRPVFVKRNALYQITVDAGVTSWVFTAGHRIRLEVSSSNFPRFDRNLNSTRPNGDETVITIAHQAVYHDETHSSSVILPVIPKR